MDITTFLYTVLAFLVALLILAGVGLGVYWMALRLRTQAARRAWEQKHPITVTRPRAWTSKTTVRVYIYADGHVERKVQDRPLTEMGDDFGRSLYPGSRLVESRDEVQLK